MSKDVELWSFITERLRRDESIMLLVVAASTGSSPGRAGFKMAVAQDDFTGSIGGGVMEVDLADKARSILTARSDDYDALVRRIHQKNVPESSGMICAGEQTVIFRKIDSSELAAVLTVIDAIETEAEKSLEITPGGIDLIKMNSKDQIGFRSSVDGGYRFTQSLPNRNTLEIVGGGHCALALSELMAKLDFRVNIYDDRRGLNTVQKNEFARQVQIVESYTSIGEIIHSDPNKYVVVMTIGFEFDKVVIRELLSKDFRYFGVLGSKAKMSVLLRELRDEGLSAERLGKIHTPIGLGISSHTPEEIAVSIAAEIISVKNREIK